MFFFLAFVAKNDGMSPDHCLALRSVPGSLLWAEANVATTTTPLLIVTHKYKWVGSH